MENRVYYGEYSLKHWIDLILKKNIVLPEYQRYFVWGEDDVKKLIDALKNKLFIPPVTIGAFKIGNENQNLILDGQQRLTSVLLAFLGLYPDKNEYKRTIEKFPDENDNVDEEEENEPLDNIFEWKFNLLVEKGKNKQEILSKISEGNYKKIEFNIDEKFLETRFLGFSYLVPYTPDEKQQQTYYSSVFRNINLQGKALLSQESRDSLYFLDNDLKHFFKPEFSNIYVVKTLSSTTKIDFVRYLSLLSQYRKDKSANIIARGYKPEMEKYYEEYIYSVINDSDSRYGKFTDIFPNKKFDNRFTNMQSVLKSIDVPKIFSSIIESDMYFFGLVYILVIEDKKINIEKKEQLKQIIEAKIQEIKNDSSHSRAPSNLRNLRLRINSSIEIYKQYAI